MSFNSQHLSDEAVAAFADGVLTGHARGRATRHCAECAECAEAVRGQREATFALRTASAPPLPTDLLDRLRGLPQVTPIHTVPTVLMPDGTTMLSTLGGAAPMAAFVPPAPAAPAEPAGPHHRRGGPFLTAAVAAALAGAFATGAALAADDAPAQPGTGNAVHTVQHRTSPDRGGVVEPMAVFRQPNLSGAGDFAGGN